MPPFGFGLSMPNIRGIGASAPKNPIVILGGGGATRMSVTAYGGGVSFPIYTLVPVSLAVGNKLIIAYSDSASSGINAPVYSPGSGFTLLGSVSGWFFYSLNITTATSGATNVPIFASGSPTLYANCVLWAVSGVTTSPTFYETPAVSSITPTTGPDRSFTISTANPGDCVLGVAFPDPQYAGSAPFSNIPTVTPTTSGWGTAGSGDDQGGWWRYWEVHNTNVTTTGSTTVNCTVDSTSPTNSVVSINLKN
jgi:hypothetical protein